jgi:hypothetical protein
MMVVINSINGLILPGTPLATGTPLSPTKKRTLFSRLSLSEPTINLSLFWIFVRKITLTYES